MFCLKIVFQFDGSGKNHEEYIAVDDVSFSPNCVHDPDNSQLPVSPPTAPPTVTPTTPTPTEHPCRVRINWSCCWIPSTDLVDYTLLLFIYFCQAKFSCLGGRVSLLEVRWEEMHRHYSSLWLQHWLPPGRRWGDMWWDSPLLRNCIFSLHNVIYMSIT